MNGHANSYAGVDGRPDSTHKRYAARIHISNSCCTLLTREAASQHKKQRKTPTEGLSHSENGLQPAQSSSSLTNFKVTKRSTHSSNENKSRCIHRSHHNDRYTPSPILSSVSGTLEAGTSNTEKSPRKHRRDAQDDRERTKRSRHDGNKPVEMLSRHVEGAQLLSWMYGGDSRYEEALMRGLGPDVVQFDVRRMHRDAEGPDSNG